MILELFASLAIAAGPRTEYVKAELMRAKVSQNYVQALFDDPRLKIYPETSVPKVAAEIPAKFSANILAIESVFRGQRFLDEYRSQLEAAELEYGVPKEEIVAVLRVESNLGEYLGKLTVFNVLYTRLANASASKWKSEVANLVALGKYCYITKIDCYEIKGSSSGAFGLAQFMPVSVLEWGVDGSGDGIVDLFDPADSIPSAANFLKQHGWEENAKLALARYYGSAKTYPSAVLGYADALRTVDVSVTDQTPVQITHGKFTKFTTAVIRTVYCLFSSIPYCKE